MTEMSRREEVGSGKAGVPIRGMLLGAAKGSIIKIVVQRVLFILALLLPSTVGRLLEIELLRDPTFFLYGFNYTLLIPNVLFGYLGVVLAFSRERRPISRIYSLAIGLIMMAIGILSEIVIMRLISPRFPVNLLTLSLENIGCVVGAASVVTAKLPTENCQKCGATNPIVAKFCWKCGAIFYSVVSVPKKSWKAKGKSFSLHAVRITGIELVVGSALFALLFSILIVGGMIVGTIPPPPNIYAALGGLLFLAIFWVPTVLGVILLRWSGRRLKKSIQ